MEVDGEEAVPSDAVIIDMDGQPTPEDLESGDEGDNQVGDAILYREEDREAAEEALEEAAAADLAATAAEPDPEPGAIWVPKGKNDAHWLPKGEKVEIDLSELYNGPSGPIGNPEDFQTELDAFDTFFPEEVVREYLVKPTNRRAQIELAGHSPPKLLERWVDVTLKEMYLFLAILFFLPLKKVPAEKDYWSSSLLQEPLVSNLIGRDRFLGIKHALMVDNPDAEENQQDRLAKTRRWLDVVRKISQQNWTLGPDVGLDESQCRCGHRGETAKPMSDYVKVIAAHESKTGYCYAFKVDERLPGETVKDLLIGVLDQLPKKDPDDPTAPGERRRIAMDRFYTSIDNAKLTFDHGHFMYGTVRSDRGPKKCKEIAEETMARPLEDGDFYWRMADQPMPITIYLWRDSVKSGSWFLSTCHSDEESEVMRRKRGHLTARKRCPLCAKEYNKHMGACDQCNSLRASYTVQLKHQRRWYMCLVYYGIDILIVNAFIFFKAISGRKTSQKTFRLAIIQGLIARAASGHRRGAPVPKRRRLSHAGGDLLHKHCPNRLVNVGEHFPVHAGSGYRNCKLCYLRDKVERRSTFLCDTCQPGPVYLCLNKSRNCFKEWHMADND
jgi:hypothetical protein